ncbi:MAG TPA: hypothetical protein VK564_09640, partial [Thermodesulfobacteriota bacterium]|nr:hypothetical protein [Thermodesulfobacteriota bacterium]
MKIEKSPFINRQADLALLQEKGQDIARGRGEDSFFIAPWGSGKTTLLKEVKELFFWGQKDLLPVYFSFSRNYSDLSDFSEDYLVKILSQILFFDQKGQAASNLSGLNRFAQIQWEAERQGKGVIGQIIENHKKAKGNKDCRKGLLNALTAPKKIGQATGRPIWVMIDHIQEIENLPQTEREVIGPWGEGLRTPWAPHLFAGEPPGYIAKYLIPAFGPSISTVLELSSIPAEEGKALIDALAKFFQVRVAEDLGADWVAYLEYNPGMFTAFIKDVRRQNSGVESHQRFADLYLKSLCFGELGRSLESGFLRETNPREGVRLLRILERLFYSEKNRATFDELQTTLSISAEEIFPLIRVLERVGLIVEHFGILQLEGRQVLKDWLEIQIRKYLRREEVEEIFRIMEAKLEKRLSERAEEAAAVPAADETGLQFSLVLPVDGEVELVAVKALEQ